MVVTQQMIGTVKSFSKLSKSFSSYSKVGIISGSQSQTACSKQYWYRHKGLKLACNTKLNRPGPIKSVNIYWHTDCRRISWHWQSTGAAIESPPHSIYSTQTHSRNEVVIFYERTLWDIWIHLTISRSLTQPWTNSFWLTAIWFLKL